MAKNFGCFNFGCFNFGGILGNILVEIKITIYYQNIPRKGKISNKYEVKDQIRATNIHKIHFKMHFTYTYKRKSEPKIKNVSNLRTNLYDEKCWRFLISVKNFH